jgi:hypothetical protein
MNQGIQHYFQNPFIREFGCFFLSLIELADRWSAQNARTLTVNLASEREFFNVVDDVYSKSIQRGFLQPDCTVLNGAGILSDLTGIKWAQLARYDFPDWHLHTLAPPASFSFFVKKLKKTGYTHFVLQWFNDTFDPLPPDRPAAQFYRFAGYRAFLPLSSPPQ